MGAAPRRADEEEVQCSGLDRMYCTQTGDGTGRDETNGRRRGADTPLEEALIYGH